MRSNSHDFRDNIFEQKLSTIANNQPDSNEFNENVNELDNGL